MTVWDIPIEPFESRYSMQWKKWFHSEYDRLGIDWSVVLGGTLTTDIETGSFLDVHGTNYYKADVLRKLANLLKVGSIKDGDWLFFHDLYFPGIEQLAYIRDASGVKFKIAGCLHAGSWDEHDFITQKGMRPWAHVFEKMLFAIVDKVFVATQYHRDLIRTHLFHDTGKIYVTGFPIYPDDFVQRRTGPRGLWRNRPLVVFPHRKDPEKEPWQFEQLMKRPELKGFDFRFTKDWCSTKSDYYLRLSQADFAVSFALQETWGIAMQEAAFSGCLTLVPARLSYREMYAQALQYADMDDLVSKLLMYESSEVHRRFFDGQQGDTNHKLTLAGRTAIPNMMALMGMR